MTEIEEGFAVNNGLAEKVGADTTWNLSGKSSLSPKSGFRQCGASRLR
jgi:hypothetical protein